MIFINKRLNLHIIELYVVGNLSQDYFHLSGGTS